MEIGIPGGDQGIDEGFDESKAVLPSLLANMIGKT